ncbi:ribonuclease HII [Candidatus Woesearchaeota archaeon]|nr:ribonuclease HII [Candidatus Woesearchaeota archaeon]
MKKTLGIDEAGRGPVIGPLVIAGVAIDKEKEAELKEIGVRDSKLLSPKKREELYSTIIRIADAYEIMTITHEQVDSAVDDPKNNLNMLEAQASAEIIGKLEPDRVILDCPSNNTSAYSSYVKKLLKDRIRSDKLPAMVVEHKADLKYTVVGAASILAKVTRDRKIAKLRERYGDFGSGYPSDPKTKEFIKDNYELPIFRKSWDTWKKAAEKKSQSMLSQF